MKTGVIILAAGISERMGCSKALLAYDGETSFLEKIVNEFSQFGCNEILVIINNENKEEKWNSVIKKLPKNVSFVINTHLEYERFFSIKSGLQRLTNSDFCFIHNIDNPFVDNELLKIIYSQRIENGFVSPRYEGNGGHPILLGKDVINGIISIQENNLNFREVMANYICVKAETPNPNILTNINTREEYYRYFKSGC